MGRKGGWQEWETSQVRQVRVYIGQTTHLLVLRLLSMQLRTTSRLSYARNTKGIEIQVLNEGGFDKNKEKKWKFPIRRFNYQ